MASRKKRIEPTLRSAPAVKPVRKSAPKGSNRKAKPSTGATKPSAKTAKPAAKRAKPAARTAKAKPACRRPTKAAPRRAWWSRLLRGGFYWGTVASLWAALLVAGLFAWHAVQLPHADTWAVPERAPDIRILDGNGHLIAHRGIGSRELSLDEMSPFLPQAVIAIEDHRFRSHFGFDPVGFSRAMARNVMAGRLRQGGSTLTQQLAKNLFLSGRRTFGRKMQELVLAFWLERRFSKDQILELYLNRVYFGHGATGVDAAARKYFGRSAARLTLRQSAVLAGSLKAPSRLNAITSPARARKRSDLVLAAMEREGFITPEQRKQASKVDAGAAVRGDRSHAWAADMAAAEVKAILGAIDRDLDVSVTLSPTLQAVARTTIRETLHARGKALGVRQGALVAMAPDGAIRALVGGRDYRRSSYDRARTAKRQPGSAFKPFLWAAALESGASPLDAVSDTPLASGSYRPRNAGERYRGEVTLAEALAVSSNTAAVRLVRHVGARRLASTANRLGIESKLTANEALALGASEVTPLELTAAYAPFGNGGLRARPYLVTRIAEPDGKVLYERKPVRGERVLSAVVAGEMQALLAGVVRDGTGGRAALGRHVAAGKTGTTQGGRDAWFAGFVAKGAESLVTTVWFGNDDATPTKASGGHLAARAWGDFMGAVLEGRVPERPDVPMLAERKVTVPTSRPVAVRLAPRERPGWIARLLGRG